MNFHDIINYLTPFFGFIGSSISIIVTGLIKVIIHKINN